MALGTTFEYAHPETGPPKAYGVALLRYHCQPATKIVVQLWSLSVDEMCSPPMSRAMIYVVHEFFTRGNGTGGWGI